MKPGTRVKVTVEGTLESVIPVDGGALATVMLDPENQTRHTQSIRVPRNQITKAAPRPQDAALGDHWFEYFGPFDHDQAHTPAEVVKVGPNAWVKITNLDRTVATVLRDWEIIRDGYEPKEKNP